jgi:hypothetical protein
MICVVCAKPIDDNVRYIVSNIRGARLAPPLRAEWEPLVELGEIRLENLTLNGNSTDA